MLRQDSVAGSLRSDCYFDEGGGTHSFLGTGGGEPLAVFMISRPSLSCIHWLEFVYRML